MAKSKHGLTSPAWLQTLLARVKVPAENDNDVLLLEHLKCVDALLALSEDPDVLMSLSTIYSNLTSANVPNPDDRMIQFFLAASSGLTVEKGRFKSPPSHRAPDIKKVANASRKLADTIKQEIKSLFPSTDRLSYLLERQKNPPSRSTSASKGLQAASVKLSDQENPSFHSASALRGLRAASFELSDLPTLRETLICFAEALEEQVQFVKSEPRAQQTVLGKYVDRLIHTSHELFCETPQALIAKVASVVSGEDVEPSRVQKRVKKLKQDGRL